MANDAIRSEAKTAGVKLWQIAEQLGINDGNFSRMLRRELPNEKKTYIIGLIREIAETMEVAG